MAIFPHKIIFIRHGETDYNAEGRLQGQMDIPLNPKGREQANAVGRSLLKLMRGDIERLEAADAFVASPLLRTRETMERARAAMGLPSARYRLDSRLKELTFGVWEGLTWPEVERADPAGATAREKNKWTFAPSGGESYAMLCDRLRPWLASLDADVFVASHGGVARALFTLVAGVDPAVAAGINIWQGRAIVYGGGVYTWLG